MRAYLRDPDVIYRRSLAAARRETDLAHIPDDLTDLAIRLVHASAMPGLVRDLAFSANAGRAGREALANGAPILADCQMAAHGIAGALLPARNDVVCTLDAPEVPELAQRLGTTRSAAAVELWRPALEGGVIAIGNAPTALFRLLELIADGAGKPALVLGFPVGFVGAAESKAALIDSGAPFITLRGRFGGSALAAAAVNALASAGKGQGADAAAEISA